MPATITFVKNRVPVSMTVANHDGQTVEIEGKVASSSGEALVTVHFEVTGHMTGGRMIYERAMHVPSLSYRGNSISAAARCQNTAAEVTNDLVQKLGDIFNEEDDALPRALNHLLTSPSNWLGIAAIAAVPTAYGNHLMTVLGDESLRLRLRGALGLRKSGHHNEEADALMEVLRATQGSDAEDKNPLDRAFEAIDIFDQLPAEQF